MQNALTISLVVIYLCMLALTCVASILGVAFQPDASIWVAAWPGILVAILCAIAGAFLIKVKLSPLEKIHLFLKGLLDGKKVPLSPGDCGSLEPLAQEVLKTDKKLEDKIHWFESILNSLPWSISVTDMNMNWQFCNTASLKSMDKTSNAQVFGKHCSEKKGNICNTPNCGIEQLRRGNTNVINHMPNGKSMRITLGYLLDQSGQRIGHVEIGEDITDRIRLERESKEAATQTRHTLVQQLEGVVAGLDSGATNLNHALEDVRNQASVAAARLAEAATAMNEMNATVLEVASNAEGAADAASSVQNQAQEGNALVVRTIDSLHTLRELSMNLRTDMEGLDKQAKDIGTVLTLIRDIADQTNLLALNAAIEAARAGEAGRGFAVVADEVRKLAEKTMSATRDVESAIESIQQGTYKSSSTMDNAVSAIEATGQVGEESGQALEHIASLSADSSMRVSAIAAAATEQSAASEEINRSITEVNHLAAEIARLMGDAVSRTAEMASETHNLTDIVEGLRRYDDQEEAKKQKDNKVLTNIK